LGWQGGLIVVLAAVSALLGRELLALDCPECQGVGTNCDCNCKEIQCATYFSEIDGAHVCLYFDEPRCNPNLMYVENGDSEKECHQTPATTNSYWGVGCLPFNCSGCLDTSKPEGTYEAGCTAGTLLSTGAEVWLCMADPPPDVPEE